MLDYRLQRISKLSRRRIVLQKNNSNIYALRWSENGPNIFLVNFNLFEVLNGDNGLLEQYI